MEVLGFNFSTSSLKAVGVSNELLKDDYHLNRSIQNTANAKNSKTAIRLWHIKLPFDAIEGLSITNLETVAQYLQHTTQAFGYGRIQNDQTQTIGQCTTALAIDDYAFRYWDLSANSPLKTTAPQLRKSKKTLWHTQSEPYPKWQVQSVAKHIKDFKKVLSTCQMDLDYAESSSSAHFRWVRFLIDTHHPDHPCLQGVALSWLKVVEDGSHFYWQLRSDRPVGVSGAEQMEFSKISGRTSLLDDISQCFRDNWAGLKPYLFIQSDLKEVKQPIYEKLQKEEGCYAIEDADEWLESLHTNDSKKLIEVRGVVLNHNEVTQNTDPTLENHSISIAQMTTHFSECLGVSLGALVKKMKQS